MSIDTQCGYIALIGRPNVGKSTLLNTILESKISITSKKPQTTRNRLLGIKTQGKTQFIFVDTPGLQPESYNHLHRYMNKQAISVLPDVDVIVVLFEALKWQEKDAWILEKLKKLNSPIIAVVNKVDKVKNKDELLPFMEMLAKKHEFYRIIPLSALDNDNVQALLTQLKPLLPAQPQLFPPEYHTDRAQGFVISEILREKIFRMMGQEIPYATAVQLEQIQEKNNIYYVYAIIWLARTSQKKIIIGEKGENLKKIGTAARLDMEKFLGKKVCLKTWVKIESNWPENKVLLRRFGYNEEI